MGFPLEVIEIDLHVPSITQDSERVFNLISDLTYQTAADG